MWNEIKNDEDIQSLMAEYCGFHDSCIVSMNYSSGAFTDKNKAMGNGDICEHTLLMTLNSQICKPVELLFKGVRKCSIVGWQDNYFCDIMDAYLGFNNKLLGKTRDDRLIVWADRSGFDPDKYSERGLISPSGYNCTYVIAEQLFWRYEQD